jgi:hypothetical protein
VGQRADPGADVDGEAADAVTGEFDLPGVAPGADAQAELAEGCAQRLGAADGPGGSVEGRQQAVSGGPSGCGGRFAPQEYEPLSVDEHLEVLATGEVVARTYRHPADMDRALEAGATWEQVAAARGCDEAQARLDYRKWAQGQHRLWAGEYGGGGKFGMNDSQYAEALARADVAAGGPGAAKAHAASHRVLCAHAGQDGRGVHWLEPGQTCLASEPVREAEAG